MKYLPHTAIVLGLLGLASAPGSAAQTPPPESGMTMPVSGQADPIANEGVIEDDAVDALKDMSKYLMSTTTLQADAIGSLDVVTKDGQRIQLDGNTTYKIRRPGFVIDYRSDIKSRRFIYDGKNFTVY